MTTKIIGPISLYEMKIPRISKDKYPKHIYLFGDEHVRNSTCLSRDGEHIVDFISDQILQNQDKIIDVYIEAPFRNPLTQNRNYLEDMQREFRDCLLQNNCINFPNARFHYVDIRQGNIESASFKILIEMYFNLLYEFENMEFQNGGDKKLYEILEKYKEIPVVKEFLKDKDLMEEKLMKKEYSKSNIPELIIDHYKSKIKPLLVTLKKSLHFIEISKGKAIAIQSWDKFLSSLIEILSFYVDIYTLLRIFRPFKKVQGKIRKKEPQNIIIYMGEEHTRSIIHFLNEIKGKIVFETRSDKEKNFQCIDIRGLDLPMFNNF